ncbi:MAG: TRAP transporter small permease [Anaerovoracaceae bacterium]|jgi:TRAP-type C4-dicarboxylate transport system permease small subunit
MQKIDKAYKGYTKFSNIGLILGLLGVYLMMLVIVLDVVTRNFFNLSITGIFEFVQYYLLPLSIFPVFGYAYSTGVMPRITMLIDKFSKKTQHIASVLVLIVNIILFTLMAWFSLLYAIQSTKDKAFVIIGMNNIPLWPLYYLVVLGFFLIIAESVFSLIQNIRTKGINIEFRAED